jgi:hypothetical protein
MNTLNLLNNNTLAQLGVTQLVLVTIPATRLLSIVYTLSTVTLPQKNMNGNKKQQHIILIQNAKFKT